MRKIKWSNKKETSKYIDEIQYKYDNLHKFDNPLGMMKEMIGDLTIICLRQQKEIDKLYAEFP